MRFPLGRIHADSIPLPTKGLNGEEYAIVVVDEFTRMKFIGFSKTKGEDLTNEFRRIIGQMEFEQMGKSLENGEPIKVRDIRTDKGKEMIPTWFQELLQKRDPPISFSPSPEYQKEFNGLAEGGVKIIKTTGICILITSRLTMIFYPYALRHAVFVLNKVKHSFTKCTPYEKWHQRKPDLSNLRTFGCLVVFYQTEE
jgi:hypothetical protein